jgi:predicted phosphodiesterase
LPGKRQPELPPKKWQELHRLLRDGLTERQIATRLGLQQSTVNKYAKRLPPKDEAAGSIYTAGGCPEPTDREYRPVEIDNTPGRWLVLSDTHLPYHDKATIESALKWAKQNRAAGVLLNGDLLDSHEVSDFDKDPTAMRYTDEIEIGKRFLTWVREQLPKARIVFKAGNHEDRLERYIVRRAPAIWGLEGLNLQSLLHLDDLDIEYVGDKRVIRLGKLNVLHGHEYKGSIIGPVNPARGIFLKARSVVLCGHWHQTSEHHEKDIRGEPQAAWSVGCACHLSPQYAPLNRWNHGWASVDVAKDGSFAVTNRRLYGA